MSSRRRRREDESILGPLSDMPPILEDSPPSLEEADEEEARPQVGGPTQVAERLHEAARIVLAVAIFLVPIVLDPRTVDAFNLVKLTTLGIFGSLAVALWISGSLLARGAGQLQLRVPESWIVRLALSLLAVTAAGT